MTVRLGLCALIVVAVIGMAHAAVPDKRDSATKQPNNVAKASAAATAKQSTSSSGDAKSLAAGGTKVQKAPAKKKQIASKPKDSAGDKKESKPENQQATDSGDSDAADKTSNVRRMHGQRDPFETVIRSQPEGPGCSTGKKCLIVDKMDLKGVVRSQNGMIAIVVTEQRKTYFLHENDPVYNGHVVKINPDSIVFRETVVDRVGRQSTRDVVKRITRPAA